MRVSNGDNTWRPLNIRIEDINRNTELSDVLRPFYRGKGELHTCIHIYVFQ
jgi:hypothetical protein